MMRRSVAMAVALVLIGIAVPEAGPSESTRARKGNRIVQRTAGGTIHLVSEDATLKRRRDALAGARSLLANAGVPIDTDALASWTWREELQPVLANIPEMQQFESRAELDGVVMADELRLGEFTDLTGDTIIIANRLVFDGQNPVIRGPYNVYVVVAESVSSGAGFDGRFGKQIRRIDTSGLGRESRAAVPVSQGVDDLPSGPSVHEAEDDTTTSATYAPRGNPESSLLSYQATSGADGETGAEGQAGDEGQAGSAGGLGDCGQSNPNGGTGGAGSLGQDGSMGGLGGDGERGGDGGNQYLQIYDDEGWWQLDASGGNGGNGGDGGRGGNGGKGGKGGTGGEGLDCSCGQGGSGNGGEGGTGGEGGIGGDGGEGGWGGDGGDGGYIEIHVYTEPACGGCVTVDVNFYGGPGGQAGAGGAHGNFASGGAGGDGGVPGGNQVCPSSQGQTGATGSAGTQGGGSPAAGFPGSPGYNGENGSYDLFTYYY